MKNFSLGVLVMMCLGLMIQNSHLHSQIAKNKSVSAPVAVKKVSAKPVAVAVKKTPVIISAQPTQYYADGKPLYNESHDPRCPSHLPYYDSHWGCVVKRP